MSSCRLELVCTKEIDILQLLQMLQQDKGSILKWTDHFFGEYRTCVEDEESRVGWIDHCAAAAVAAPSADL